MGPSRLRSAVLLLVVAATLALASAAEASPSAKLTYVRGVGAEKCPDEQALRKAVAERLGFDVFFPWARRTVVAEIDKGAHGFRARLQILGEDGVVLGVRAIDATSESCEDVMRALALALSIAVDDFGLDDVPPPSAAEVTPAPPSLPEPAPLSASLVAPPTPSAPPPPTRTPLDFSLALAPVVAFGIAPAPSVGLEGSFDVRLHSPFSVGVDLRGDLPASGAHVETYVLAASFVPCVRLPAPLVFCAVGSLGSFHESGVGFTGAKSDHALYAAVGARVGVELPLGHRFFLAADADGAFDLTRTPVSVNGEPAFQLPIFVPSIAAGGGVIF